MQLFLSGKLSFSAISWYPDSMKFRLIPAMLKIAFNRFVSKRDARSKYLQNDSEKNHPVDFTDYITGKHF